MLTVDNPLDTINGNNYTEATATIVDNDGADLTSLLSSQIFIPESNISLEVCVTLTDVMAGLDRVVSVDVTVVSGSAVEGEDFNITSVALTFAFAPHNGDFTCLNLSIIDDNRVEYNETFLIVLVVDNPLDTINGGSNVFANVIIEDNDGAAVMFSHGGIDVVESIGHARVCVELVYIMGGLDRTLFFEILAIELANVPGSQSAAATAIIAGSCSRFIGCCNPAVIATCSVGGCYCDQICHRLNDCCPDVFESGCFPIGEAFSGSGLSYGFGGDFFAGPFILMFEPGSMAGEERCVNVPVVNDNIVECDEVFAVVLYTQFSHDAVVGDRELNVTILDDDASDGSASGSETVPSIGPLTCGEAGFSGCCSEGGCFVETGNCYCDEFCHLSGNCCPDILDIDCFLTPSTVIDGPEIVTISEGDSVNVSCISEGIPALSVEWMAGGVPASFQEEIETLMEINGSLLVTVISVLQIDSALASDGGNYTCTGISTIGGIQVSSSSDSIEIIVDLLNPEPVMFTAFPGTLILNTSEAVTLECVAVGVPEPLISWLRLPDFEDLGNDTALNISSTTSEVNGSSAVVSTLVASSPFELGLGQFLCSGVNNVGSEDMSTANITFEVILQIPPLVTAQSESVEYGVAGGEVEFTCTAMAYPLANIVWLFNNMTLSAGTAQFSVNTVLPEEFTVMSTLAVTSLNFSNVGSYSCEAHNELEPVDSSNFSQLVLHYPADVSLDPLFVGNISEPLLLTCEAFGNPKPAVNWFDNEDNILSNETVGFNITETEDSDLFGVVVTLQLLIIELNMSFEGRYTCIADNGVVNLINASKSLTTEVVTALVSPLITAVPTSLVGVIGQNVTLEFVIVMAQPPVNVDDVVLQFNSEIVQFTFNFSNSHFLFNITTLAESDQGLYTLLATTAAGTGNASIYLDIQRPPTAIVVPDSLSAVAGVQITFVCQVLAEPNSTVYWVFEERMLITEGRINISDPAVLVISNITLSDAGQYSCNSSNIHGFDISSAVLIVQEPPHFTAHPEPSVVNAVQTTAVITCTASGFPAPSINWLFNGSILVSLSGNTTLQTILPFTAMAQLQVHNTIAESSLTLSALNKSFTGSYHCEAYNDLVEMFVAVSTLACLQVQYPPNITSSVLYDRVLNESDSLLLSCTLTGNPLPEIVWTFVDGPLSSLIDASTANISSIELTNSELPVLQSTLFISHITQSNEGQYTCQGMNNVPNLIGAVNTMSANVTVQVPPTVIPANGAFQDGVVTRDVVSGVAVLTFAVLFDSPPVRLQDIVWMYKDAVTGQVFDEEALLQLSPRYAIFSDRLSFTITNLSLCDSGIYTLVAGNAAGVGNSSITLRTLAEPQIFDAPGSGSITTLPEGESVTFSCSADGIPPPTITWLLNNILLQPDLHSRLTEMLVETSGVRPNITTGVTSTLTISNLMPVSDIGAYSCRATSVGELDVLRLPFELNVTTRPVDHCAQSPCINEGTCINFPSGFLCQCNDDYTGVTCDEEIIRDSPAMIVKPPLSTFGTLYQTVNLSCESIGIPTPVITWFKDGVVLPEEHLPYLLITEITPVKRGLYSCSAMNVVRNIADPSIMEEINVYSNSAIVNIKDIVQLTFVLPNSAYEGQFSRQEAINQLSEILAGQRIENSTILSLETLLTVDIESSSGSSLLMTVFNAQEISNSRLRNEVQLSLAAAVTATDLNFTVTSLERFDGCQVEHSVIPSNPPRSDLEIILQWPETDIGRTAVINCPCANLSVNSTLIAMRVCSGNFATGGMWEIPMQDDCNFTTIARQICQISNIEDTMQAVMALSSITEQQNNIEVSEVILSTLILETLTTDVEQNDSLALTVGYLEVVDNILEIDTDVLQMSQEQSNTSARLLDAVESVAENVAFAENETSAVITLNTFAVVVQEVVQEEFSGQTFSVNLGDQFGFESSQQINGSALVVENTDMSVTPLVSVTGSITIPPSILNATMQLDLPANISDRTRITHSVFLTDSLFLRRNQQNDDTQVGSIIIAASLYSPLVGNIPVNGVSPPINLIFTRRPDLRNATESTCNFWDPMADSGYGDWSQDGCQLVNSTNDSVTCECDHLTNFAILLDVSPNTNVTPPPAVAKTLESITFIGIIVSVVCLVLTIVTYLSTVKLRSSDAGKLVVNLCFSFLGIYLSFILSFFSPEVDGLCVFAGILVHFFLLATFFIMAAEAINLYILLVVVIGMKIERYVLKTMLIAWSLPVIIIIPSVAPDYHNYINPNFCRPYGVPFWAGLLAPFVIIYVFNWVVFLVIILSVTCKNRHKQVASDNSKSKLDSKKQLTIAITLSILFGLGWGFGIPATQGISVIAIRTIFQALFIILTSFQGFFIFIMQCLRSPIAREKWWEWYYEVTCRGGDYRKRGRGRSILNKSAQTWYKPQQKSSTLTTTGFNSETLKRAVASSALQHCVVESDFTSMETDNTDSSVKPSIKRDHPSDNVLLDTSDSANVAHNLTFQNPMSRLQYSEVIDKLGSPVLSPQQAYSVVFKNKPDSAQTEHQHSTLSIDFKNAVAADGSSEMELEELVPIGKDTDYS